MKSWIFKHYNELSLDELYLILKIRQEIFIVEQNCSYLDADNLDKTARHLMGYKDEELIAYMRVVDANQIYKTISFGRILVKDKFRKSGVGRELMKEAIALFPKNEIITISAQVYLKQFYKEFNFEPVGQEYLEDGIPHIKMIRNGNNLL